MKKLAITFAAALLTCGAMAEEPVAATLRADGSTNTWTAAELQDALGLMNRMYWREMETDAGRRRWHGERMAQYVFTNGTQMVRIDFYADGFAATNYARTVRAKSDPEAAAKAAAAQAEWERTHLPPALAALREAQRAAAQTNTVTVTEVH